MASTLLRSEDAGWLVPSTGGPALPLDPEGRRPVRPGFHAPPSPRPTSQGAGGRERPVVAGKGAPAAAPGPPLLSSSWPRLGGWRGKLGAAGNREWRGLLESPYPPAPRQPVWQASRTPSRLVRSVLRCVWPCTLVCANPAVLQPLHPVPGGPGLEAGRRVRGPLPKKKPA